jgi:hypothetical protein
MFSCETFFVSFLLVLFTCCMSQIYVCVYMCVCVFVHVSVCERVLSGLFSPTVVLSVSMCVSLCQLARLSVCTHLFPFGLISYSKHARLS